MAGPIKVGDPGANIAQVTAEIAKLYGEANAAKFTTWYNSLHGSLTPSAAGSAWVLAMQVGGSLSKALNLLTGGTAKLGNSATGTISSASGPGVPQAAAKGAEQLAPGGTSPACALHIPSFAGFGGWCIISKTALRGGVGGLVLAGAGIVGAVAVVILASHGLHNTAAGAALSRSGGAVKGAAAAAGLG